MRGTEALRRLATQLALGGAILGALTLLVPRPDDRGEKAAVRGRLAALRPELVLIGNSLIQQDVDATRLGAALGLRVGKLTADGSQSAWWYLAFKNVVATLAEAPRVVAIGFQDLALTDPVAGVTGEAGQHVRDLMDGDEELLRERALVPAFGRPLLFLLDHCRLYAARAPTREALERRLRDNVVAGLLGLPPGGGTQAYAAALSNQRLDRELLAAYQTTVTNPGGSSPDFDAVVDATLLPAIIELAQQRGVRLVFIRMPRLSDARGIAEAPALTRYVERLAAWLAARGVALIDCTRAPKLAPADFSAGDHLNAHGAQVVTDALAEELRCAGASGN